MPFTSWKHTEIKETVTETEKSIYYDFMRYADSPKAVNSLPIDSTVFKKS